MQEDTYHGDGLNLYRRQRACGTNYNDNKGDRYTIIAGGTSRNICKDICQPLLEADGLTLGGPMYNGRSDKTPYRQFWR